MFVLNGKKRKMEKIKLFKLVELEKLDLVKGCPTDFNCNNVDDDDFNNDGNYDSLDVAYWDGYIDGHDAERKLMARQTAKPTVDAVPDGSTDAAAQKDDEECIQIHGGPCNRISKIER